MGLRMNPSSPLGEPVETAGSKSARRMSSEFVRLWTHPVNAVIGMSRGDWNCLLSVPKHLAGMWSALLGFEGELAVPTLNIEAFKEYGSNGVRLLLMCCRWLRSDLCACSHGASSPADPELRRALGGAESAVPLRAPERKEPWVSSLDGKELGLAFKPSAVIVVAELFNADRHRDTHAMNKIGRVGDVK